MPTVDILMATYNGERYVCEQVQSVQTQTYEDWRLLVSDDCSSDGTVAAVVRMAKADRRISLFFDGVRHGSAKANFMSLLAKSSASHVMLCDQDDVWLPWKVELTLSRMVELEAEQGADRPLMVFTDMKVVDEELNVIHESFERSSNIDPDRTRFPQLLAQSVGAGCTMMVNRRAIEIALMARGVEGMVMHDWWLSLVCSAFGAIAYVDDPTSLYRQHGGNEVGAKSYSPLERASHFDGMCKSVAASAGQATAFLEIYADMLNDAQKKVLEDFVTACNASGPGALLRLAKSGCWKKGLRKLGQIAVVLKGGA